MDLVKRAQGIILKPKEEWAVIKDEPTTIPQLFTKYACILAAIPAVATFLGWALVGFRVPYSGASWTGRGLLFAIFSYVLGLVSVYALGFVINALAPNFGSTPNPTLAMKLAVYSMTPGWVAGVFHLIPALGILAVIGSLYGLYVLYLGFSHPLMGTPKEKVVGYIVVCAVVVFVLMFVVSAVLGAAFAMRGVMSVF
jgi:hypothetical protein